MNFRGKIQDVPKNTVTVNIYTNGYENDLEFEVSKDKATEIQDKFMKKEIIFIVEDGSKYFINPDNIISIEIKY